MPYVQFAPAYSHFAKSDPVVDFLAAALGAESPKSKPATCAPATCQRRPARAFKRIINPHFDVSELESEYILEGELPGVSDKSSIAIAFDDAQTIVVKGEVQRVSREAPKAELTEAALQASAAAEPQTEQQDAPKRHSVTIEDEVDESETASNASFEVVDGPTPSKSDKGKAKATEDVEMSETKPTEQPKEEAKPATPATKYWISERPIGVFERKFNFQGLIDQDNVKAHLENGLLTVVVPKRQAYVRQVLIN